MSTAQLRIQLSGLVISSLVLLAGCRPGSAPEQAAKNEASPAPPTAVRVLVFDDPELAAAIERQWNARAEDEIQVAQASLEQLLDAETPFQADVIIYPTALLGTLAEQERIVPIPDARLDALPFVARDVFNLVRAQEMRWGERTTYGVSFGSPPFVLAYRADIFEQLKLEPPSTWAEYQTIVEQLRDRQRLGELAPPSEQAWLATLEPLGPGWAGQLLLARAAAAVNHRSQYSTWFDLNTMEPLIDQPPFVRALTELVAAAQPAADELLTQSPHEAMRRLLAGEAAMAITWPTRALEPAEAAAVGVPAVRVAFAELPGTPEAYSFADGRWEARQDGENSRATLLAVSGRVGSVTREAEMPLIAANMLTWLAGEDWSPHIAPRSPHTTLFRHSQVSSPLAWVNAGIEQSAARDYARTVQKVLNSPDGLLSVRIPGRAEYLAALDEAVQRAVRGESSPEEALQSAAERWREITERRGVEAQKLAYQRSLGLIPAP